MAKALVIRNADFSVNKLDTVEFDDIPCTGISLSQDSYTLSDYTPVVIEYTITPADTTDSLTWSSSNPNVVTVSNGTMTVVGIGTCTITAMCGSQTATASVTVNIAYIEAFRFSSIVATNNHAGITTNYSRLAAVGSGVQSSEYGLQQTSEIEPIVHVIKVPHNTASVRISYDTTKSAMIYNAETNFWFYWFKDTPSPDQGYSAYAQYISTEADKNLRSAGTYTFNVPQNADCFAMVLRTTSTYTSSDDANDVAEAMGLTIEFLTTSVNS